MIGPRFYIRQFRLPNDDDSKRVKRRRGFAGTEKDTNYVDYGNRWPKTNLIELVGEPLFQPILLYKCLLRHKIDATMDVDF